jgi:hypothetical protein
MNRIIEPAADHIPIGGRFVMHHSRHKRLILNNRISTFLSKIYCIFTIAGLYSNGSLANSAAPLTKKSRDYMSRVQTITQKGKNIISIDLSNCKPTDAIATIHEAKRVITKQAPKSALVLTDVTNAVYDKDVANAIKDFTNANTPYMKGSAVIGADGVRRVLLDTIIFLTRRELKTFPSRELAISWLVSLS